MACGVLAALPPDLLAFAGRRGLSVAAVQWLAVLYFAARLWPRVRSR